MSYIDMNQPCSYMYSPSRSPIPPPSPPNPSGSSQCTRPKHLSHASNLGWWSASKHVYYLWYPHLLYWQEVSLPLSYQGRVFWGYPDLLKGMVKREVDRGGVKWQAGDFFPFYLFCKNNFYWNIVALQCYISFCCIAVWISYTYVPFFYGFPSHLGHHRAVSRVPCTMVGCQSESESCSVVFDSVNPTGQSTGVDSCSVLQGSFQPRD